MAYDQKTVERVLRVLSKRRKVVEKKMIGGLCFMVDGRMCCGVTATGLLVRVGAEARKRTLAEPHVRPMKFAGRSLAGFVLVAPEGYRTDAALAKWVQRGLEFASTVPQKKPATKIKGDPAAALAAKLEGLPGVVVTRKLNSTNFTVAKKVFAFTLRGDLVMKLPQDTIKRLVKSKSAAPLVMGKRVMKEWVLVPAGKTPWLPLAKEARDFVKQGKKR